LVDCNPANVYGSDVVSESNKPASHTLKMLAIPIRLGYMTATWTGTARVPRINKPNGNATQLCFVLYEHA
jgi:hypothetical protein